MSEVWLTHSNLTAAHDMKVLRAAVGTWVGSGWQVRDDQSDPVPVLTEDSVAEPDRPAEPDPDRPAEPDPEPSATAEPRATKSVPKLDPVTTKKGD